DADRGLRLALGADGAHAALAEHEALPIRMAVTVVVAVAREFRGRHPDRPGLPGQTAAISTDCRTTSSTGRSPAPVRTAAISSTTFLEASSATSPKIVCLPISHGVGSVVMKN